MAHAVVVKIDLIIDKLGLLRLSIEVIILCSCFRLKGVIKYLYRNFILRGKWTETKTNNGPFFFGDT